MASTRGTLCVAVVLFSSLPVILTGCPSSSSPPEQTTQNEETSDDQISTPEQCERDIDNILDALQPDRYGISSDRDTTVNMLSTWLRQCGAAEDFEPSAEDEELRARLLSDETNEQIALDQFTDVDAGYVRNCLLLRQMIDSTLTDERTDIERAVALFYKVMQTVELVRDVPGAIELGPFQSMLYGRGTAQSRAWIYATMLRNLRIDVVVIRSRADENASDRSLMLGVIIPEDGVYLFDCQLGLPIASPQDDSESPFPSMPATLVEALENDAIFRQYDLRGIPYPVNAEKMSDVEILAIGTSSTWAPRFGKLQLALPVPVEVYDGLGTSSPDEPGLIERLTTAGEGGLWDVDDIKVWGYTDETIFQLKSLTDEQKQAMQQLADIMRGPIHVAINPETGQPTGPELPERNLHQGRISHLQGDIQSAFNVYFQSRVAIRYPQTLNQQTADWAAYWVALAQYEQENYSTVVESTEQYLKTPGTWTLAAATLRANALAESGHYDEAVKILEREPVRAPQYLGNQARVRRWRRLAAGESAVDPQLTAPPAEPETTTEEPKAPADEPKSAEDKTAEQTPPDPETPKETPEDLPASDDKPDPRFEEEPQADPSPAEETPPSEDGEGAESDSSEESSAEPDDSDSPEAPSDAEGENNE